MGRWYPSVEKEKNIMRNPVRSMTSGISGALVLIGLFLAFIFGGFNLPIFFVALAFASLIGSFGSLNPRGVYGGIQGFVWLLGLALCFAIGFWPWILLVAAVSVILGALIRPIIAGLLGLGIFGLASMANRQRQQQYYQPPQQPYPPYQQGYQSPAPPHPPTYEEGGRQYSYPQQYEQPQAQYPEEMPPQQQ
jgi:hypothetical protein